MGDKLKNFFEDYIKKDPIFVDKKALQSNYTPKTVPHRENEIQQLAGILAPSLRMEKCSNVFVYGKTGCISGSSFVYTNKGYVQIKNIDPYAKVLTFNIKTKQYEWLPFVFLQFENKDKLLKITLENGYELIVTKDHPLLLHTMRWRKSDELHIGDLIIVGYDLPSLSSKEISLSLARLLGFVIADGSLNKRERMTKDSRGHWYKSNRRRFRYFSDDISLLHLVKNDLLSLFEYTPTIIYENGKCPYVQVISQKICQTLNLYDIPFGKKSDIVQVPSIILECSSCIQREFLKVLFTADGTVSRHTYMVEYYSNSKILLQQISYLLHQEGITCKIRPKTAFCKGKTFHSYRLYISGQENLMKFSHKIGFYSSIKKKRMKQLLGKYIKNMGLHQDSYFTYKIVNIEETYEPYVYDLTVPKNHNFIANGIISHNTGKTLCVKHVTENMTAIAEKNNINFRVFYLNCKLKRVADTEYRLIAQLAREFGIEVPATGLPTDEIYKIFLRQIDKERIVLSLILDEIDQLVEKTGDEVLYNLTRINSELKNSEVSLIGISNDLVFTDNLDPRVKSSLSEEELVFSPYNALQLQKILWQRAKLAFKEGVVGEGVIEKCAAYAAREHGDARRALELLRVSGELVERDNKTNITEEYIDKAEEKIERDRILDIVSTQPKQFKLTLYSIFNCVKGSDSIFTGEIYDFYKDLCLKTGTKPLTQRRVGDIIAELDMLGIINAKVISKGRYGRTRQIGLAIPTSTAPKVITILKDGLNL